MGGYGLIIAAVMLETTAQVALKRGALRVAAQEGVLRYWWAAARQPWIAAAVLAYAIELLAWIGALHSIALNVAFPLLSLSYCGVALAARLFLGERFTPRSGLAIALITVGAALVGWASA